MSNQKKQNVLFSSENRTVYIEQLITIKNKAGKAIKKAKVTLKVKGKVYKATTNKKGKATFNLKINKKGQFKATIKVKASKYYKKASKKVKIKVK